jgi:hypothetical protein
VPDFVGADRLAPDVVGLLLVGCGVVGSVGVVSVSGGNDNVGTGVVGGVESSFARWTISQTKPIRPRIARATPPTIASLRWRSRRADRRTR